uniref:Uncharacterized protein n=1 Tax=Arundo donax TaxID=35708 RepID=A0A0A9GJZ0_ARUDO
MPMAAAAPFVDRMILSQFYLSKFLDFFLKRCKFIQQKKPG